MFVEADKGVSAQGAYKKYGFVEDKRFKCVSKDAIPMLWEMDKWKLKKRKKSLKSRWGNNIT